LEFVFIFLIALSVLVIKYFKSKLQERLRIGLAIFSLVFSSVFPFLAFTLNSIFGLLEAQSGTEVQSIIFLGPTLLIPLVFAYAVLKNKLLGVGIGVRRFVVYSILTTLITIIYFTASIIFSAVLPFWKQISKEPIFNVLFLVILTAILQQLRKKIQQIVDRAFSVNPLDYSALAQTWNNELVKTVELGATFRKVTQQLPVDYHYKNASLLISQPQILQFLIANSNNSVSYRIGDKATIPNLVVSSTSQQLIDNGETYNTYNHITTGASYNQNLTQIEMRPNFVGSDKSLDCFTVELSQLYWDCIRSQDWTLKQDVALPAAIQAEFSKLDALNVEVAIPLRLGDEFYGALLLGQKISEYFPPPLDELEHLGSIAIQIAASLHNSLLLAETRALAEKERNQRLTSEAIARRTQKVRQQALSDVAEALHGGPLQALFFLQKSLNRIVNDVTNGLPMDTNAVGVNAKNVGEVITDLRNVTGELRLFGVENDFEGGIKRLKANFQDKHCNLHFSFDFNDKSKLADVLLTEQVKVALFRVIQEAINNSLKHAQAHNIEIT